MFGSTLKTGTLLITLSALMMALGQLLGGHTGLQIALLLSVIFNGASYWFGAQFVLALYRAQPLDPHTHHTVHETVDRLAHAMHLPKPQLHMIPMAVPNAFATGRSPAHAHVAITPAIIELLTPDELEGVLAHELGHIKNRDMLVSTIAATLASTIGYLANMAQYMAFWGSFRSDRRQSSSPLGLLVVALIAPLAATLLRLAVSRSREYLADQTGARYAHPLSLASALRKIEQHARGVRTETRSMPQAATASLFLVNPFKCLNLFALFSTHPPTEKRIEKLERMHLNRFQ